MKNFFDVNDRTLEPSEVHRKDKEELYETAFNKDQKTILDDMEGGGSSLPEVTEDDNGKVLTVVEGEWDKAESSLPPNIRLQWEGIVPTTYTTIEVADIDVLETAIHSIGVGEDRPVWAPMCEFCESGSVVRYVAVSENEVHFDDVTLAWEVDAETGDGYFTIMASNPVDIKLYSVY